MSAAIHQPAAPAPGKTKEEEGAPSGGGALPVAAFSPGSGMTLPPLENEASAPRAQELT